MRILELILPKNSDQKIPGLHPPDRHNREQLRKDIDQANAEIDYDEDFGPMEEDSTIDKLGNPVAEAKSPEEFMRQITTGGTRGVRQPASANFTAAEWGLDTQKKPAESIAKKLNDTFNLIYNSGGNKIEMIRVMDRLMQQYQDYGAYNIIAIEVLEGLFDRYYPDGRDPVSESKKKIKEAVRRVPLSEDDFDRLKEVLNHYIPATLSEIYLNGLIQDDELDDRINEFEKRDPNLDIRPLIVEWIDRVMPDQKYRFYPDQQFHNRRGNMSVVHGYDSGYFRGTNDPITGNAYGRF
jgi:hypothetical protein